MLDNINLNIIDLLEKTKIFLEKIDSTLEANKKLKEYKATWQLCNNFITAHMSVFTDNMIDKMVGIKEEKTLSSPLSEHNSLNNAQKILFNTAIFDNKLEIADYIKDNYNNFDKSIQRNSNIYWLQRISELFDTYKEDGTYSNQKVFNKDKLKIQKICCDYLYGGSKEDYKNIKYFASAIKSGQPLESLLDFSKENNDSLAIERTKLGELLDNYYAVQEPTKNLITLFAVTCLGAATALGLPPNITWAAAGAFLGKVKDVAKLSLKIQNSLTNSDIDPTEYKSLHKSSSEWEDSEENMIQVFSECIANNIVKDGTLLPNLEKISLTHNLSYSSTENLKTVSSFTKKEANDFIKLRNINLRTLYIKAAQGKQNVNKDNSQSITLETIKNLDSLFTVRSFENYNFKEFNLEEAISKIDTVNNNIPEIIRDSYQSVYEQANLHNKNTKNFLSSKCYTDGKINLNSFNKEIVKECSDLIKDTTFLKFAGRFITHTCKTIGNKIPFINTRFDTESITKSKNDKLTKLIIQVKPAEYFMKKQDIVDKEAEIFKQQTESRIGNILATMRNKTTNNQQGLKI